MAVNPAIDTVVESRADVAPRLRTLLLTDLCNSTELVEKLGDARSAELFQAHDRLVLELQRRWRARLIDRSDGLLLLFERAIDGLGFALDYVRGLRELGKEHAATLQARAGLHVGEVLTWQNSTEAVTLGAKPLEVEGLAKPMAARLMTLARPGQDCPDRARVHVDPHGPGDAEGPLSVAAPGDSQGGAWRLLRSPVPGTAVRAASTGIPARRRRSRGPPSPP